MKKRYLLAILAAMTVLAGCGNNGAKQEQTSSTTENQADAESTEAEATADSDTASMDENEPIDEEFSQDMEENEEIEVEDPDEEVALDPITPSDYLVENASDYATLGDYDGVEVTRYTYEITDEMIQEEIQEELVDSSEEESTDAPSVDGNVVYMNLTSTVEGEEAGDPEDTFITLGQEELGAEFDEKLTGVSAGDTLEFSITYGDDTWEDAWVGKTVDFTVEVTDVTNADVPEYDDDYVKNYTGYDTKEEYEASVKDYLEQSYEEQSYYDEIESLMNACIEKTTYTGEYPDDLFEACKEEALSTYAMFVDEDGDVNDILDMFGITEADIEEEAKALVNRRLFISAYVQANNIEVTEEEYMDYVKENADYYGENAADFEEAYTRETIVNALYESKVTDILMEKATVTEMPYPDEEYDDEYYDDEEELDDMEVIGDTEEMEEVEDAGEDTQE